MGCNEVQGHGLKLAKIDPHWNPGNRKEGPTNTLEWRYGPWKWKKVSALVILQTQ